MWVVWGDGRQISNEFGRAPLQLPTPTSAYQPFVADVHGTMRSSLIYQFGSSLSSFTFPDISQPLSLDNLCEPRTDPHSNAHVDIDGDCRADLVLSCKDLLLIYLNSDSGFVFSKSVKLPIGSGRVSFTDVNGDVCIIVDLFVREQLI